MEFIIYTIITIFVFFCFAVIGEAIIQWCRGKRVNRPPMMFDNQELIEQMQAAHKKAKRKKRVI